MGPILRQANIPFIMGNTLNAFIVLFIISAALRFLVIFTLIPFYRENDSKPVRHLVSDMVGSVKGGITRK